MRFSKCLTTTPFAYISRPLSRLTLSLSWIFELFNSTLGALEFYHCDVSSIRQSTYLAFNYLSLVAISRHKRLHQSGLITSLRSLPNIDSTAAFSKYEFFQRGRLLVKFYTPFEATYYFNLVSSFPLALLTVVFI